MIELLLVAINTKNKRLNFNIRLAVGLIGVLLFGGWLYCTEVVKNPENVLWGSLNNSLSTASVVRSIEQKQPGLEVSRSVRATSGENLSVRALTDIEQTTSKSKLTKVKSENITTKDKNLVRYLSIESDTRKSELKNIENKWFINPSSNEQNTTIIYEALGLTPGYITGSPPIVLLNSNIKSDVLPKLKDVYKPNFASVKKITVDGKQAYEYEVEIDVSNYVEFLQYIRNKLGLSDLGLNPEDFRENQPVKTVIVVAINGRQIMKITDSETNRQESYSNYGAITNLQIPEPNISRKIIDATLR